MQRFVLLLTLSLLTISFHYSQSGVGESGDEVNLQKLVLSADLRSLSDESLKLENPLARALAKVEIADAAWNLDQEWAKKLLREAYALTLPSEEEQLKLRNKPAGTRITQMTSSEQSQYEIRHRVLAVAGRDKTFADSLVLGGMESLGKQNGHVAYATLASKAVESGDKETASRFVLQSLSADPTLANAGFAVLDLAVKDRAAADTLILQYIERLRVFPLSFTNGSASRAYFTLSQMIFPNPMLARVRESNLAPPAGQAVVKAYASFIVESMSSLEQREPGSARGFRDTLLSAWLPLNKYAPELIPAFMELENLSRRPGESAILPQDNDAKRRSADYEKMVEKALKDEQPDALTINLALSREDFDAARKLIDKLPDDGTKVQYIETLNTRQAISLATKGDLLEASVLAGKLKRATSLLQVYPVIIGKCVAKKDETCATIAVSDAVKQLKRADTEPAAPPQGMPQFKGASKEEFDPVLSALSKLAKSVASINETLAFEVLDEVVSAANRSSLDTGQGRAGFDSDLFKMLAAKDENRTRQSAENFKNPLQKIVALAGMYQREAQALAKAEKTENRISGTTPN